VNQEVGATWGYAKLVRPGYGWNMGGEGVEFKNPKEFGPGRSGKYLKCAGPVVA